MPRLHLLLKSVVTTIVRYHASETKDTEIPEETIVISLLDVPNEQTLRTLQEMLTTTSHCKDNALYQYLLSSVSRLHSILQTKEAITESTRLRAIDSITQLITNIQTLLITSHRTVLHVTYQEFGIETHLDIAGLLNKGWFSNALTPSGQMLCDTLFPILGLPTTASAETVALTLKALVQEHQKMLDKERTIEELRQENIRLKYRICGLLPSYSRSTTPSIMDIERQRSNSNPMPIGHSRFGFHAPSPHLSPLDLSEAIMGAMPIEEQENSP